MSKKCFVEQGNDGIIISDGYHTMDELYIHRTKLFAVICNNHKSKSYKSRLHSDGTMFEGMFIVVIRTIQGDYSYHCDNKYWELFDIEERAIADEWDGHTPDDIDRLFNIL